MKFTVKNMIVTAFSFFGLIYTILGLVTMSKPLNVANNYLGIPEQCHDEVSLFTVLWGSKEFQYGAMYVVMAIMTYYLGDSSDANNCFLSVVVMALCNAVVDFAMVIYGGVQDVSSGTTGGLTIMAMINIGIFSFLLWRIVTSDSHEPLLRSRI